MEASAPNRHHRKRKQRSQSPSSSNTMFTRSKFQVYVHLNRSGQARHDSVRKPAHQFSHLTRSRLRKRNLAENINEDIPMKDLRARRVFSTGPTCHDAASKPVDQFSSKPMISESGSDYISIEEDLQEDKNNLENCRKSDMGFSGNVDWCGSDGDSGAMVTENIENFDNSGKKLVNVPSLNTADNEKESVENQVVLDVGSDQTKVFTPSGKMVVNLYTRQKVFRVPGSFSYRRLLPFLKDITQDESRVLKTEIVDEGFPDKFKNSTNGNCNMDVDSVTSNSQTVMEYPNAVKCKNVSEYSDDRKPENGANHKVEVPSISKVQDSDMVQNDITVIPGDCRLNNREFKDKEVCLNEGDKLMEDCVQMTPPDADIFSKFECRGENVVGKCVDANGICGRILNGGISINNVPNTNNSQGSPNQKNGTLPKTKLVLNPCSRLKVFKPLGSVSYRKLLPYLTSVAAGDSCISKSGNQANTKELEVYQDPASSASPKVEISQATIPESSLKEKWSPSKEQKQTSPGVSPTYGSDDNHSPNLSVRQLGSSNDPSNREPRSLTSSNIGYALNGHTEGAIKPDAIVSSSHTVMEPSHSEVVPGSKICHEIQPTNSTLEVSLYEGDGNHRVVLKQSSSSNEACDEPGKNIDGPRKGILKGNPRGCRGPCSCLSCSSFRLNAERSFEFSRNQMQDTKEIALDLIKELTGLRYMLEKSAANVNDPAVVHLNQLQVEEACRKALAKEELAKERLSEMNEDLQIHCRTRSLQRPRVAFSSQFDEEKVFPSRKD